MTCHKEFICAREGASVAEIVIFLFPFTIGYVKHGQHRAVKSADFMKVTSPCWTYPLGQIQAATKIVKPVD